MEGSPDERNDDTESENKVMDELKKKSRGIRNNQEVFVKQMKESLDDVVKAQEGITKSLNEIGMVLMLLLDLYGQLINQIEITWWCCESPRRNH